MPHQIPHFNLDSDQKSASVTRWGVAGGLLFAPGDRLLLGEKHTTDHNTEDGVLLMLKPRGFGAVMLGRRVGGRLLGEPGGVPASPIRWDSIGSILAVERPIQRCRGQLLALGTGHWILSQHTHARFRAFTDEDDVSWVRLDQLLKRQMLDEGMVVGRSRAAAEALPPRPGWIRFVLLPPPASVVSGPWTQEPRQAEPLKRFSRTG